MMKEKTRVLIVLPGHGKKGELEQSTQEQETLVQALVDGAPENFSIEYADATPYVPRTGLQIIDKLVSRLGALSRLPRLLSYNVILSSDASMIECLAALWRKATRGRYGPRWFFIALNTSVLSRRLRSKPLRLLLMQFCWRQCTEIMCLARFQRKGFIAAGVPRERLSFISLGIDAHFFSFIPKQPDGEYLLSVGFDLGRDYDYLLHIAEQFPHPIRIFVSPKNIPHGTPVPPNVTVRYDVSFSEFRDALAAARMVVIPTKEQTDEGSDCSGQTVILQALASGTPVCATLQPWMRDYLREGEEFVALPKHDSEAAVKVLSDLWMDNERRQQLSSAGRRVVEERFTIPLWAKAIFERIASNGDEHPTEQ